MGLGLYVALGASLFGFLLYQSSINPADSGEGGVLLLLLAMPWLSLGVPFLAAIGLNMLLAFLLPFMAFRRKGSP